MDTDHMDDNIPQLAPFPARLLNELVAEHLLWQGDAAAAEAFATDTGLRGSSSGSSKRVQLAPSADVGAAARRGAVRAAILSGDMSTARQLLLLHQQTQTQTQQGQQQGPDATSLVRIGVQEAVNCLQSQGEAGAGVAAALAVMQQQLVPLLRQQGAGATSTATGAAGLAAFENVALLLAAPRAALVSSSSSSSDAQAAAAAAAAVPAVPAVAASLQLLRPEAQAHTAAFVHARMLAAERAGLPGLRRDRLPLLLVLLQHAEGLGEGEGEGESVAGQRQPVTDASAAAAIRKWRQHLTAGLPEPLSAEGEEGDEELQAESEEEERKEEEEEKEHDLHARAQRQQL